jgi:hypothetical protein
MRGSDDDTMGDTVPVQIRVDEGQNERWEDFVTGSATVSSKSDLIRTAVEQYIADADTSSSDGLNDDAVTEIMDTMDGLESGISQVEDQIRLLRLDMLDDDEMAGIVSNEVEVMLEIWLQNQTEELLDAIPGTPEDEY